MDILEPKQKTELDNNIHKIIDLIKFKKNPIEIKGSASLKSQKFFSDYDLFSKIRGNNSSTDVYNEFKGMLKQIIDSDDIYFVELKLQTLKGDKYKWFPDDNFKLNDFIKHFKDVDYVKLDIIVRIENRFMEVSCIYKFNTNKLTQKEYINSINSDIKELKKENKYYKILKRMFNIYKAEDNKNKLLLLSKVFNGELGKLYQKTSNMDAIEMLLKHYKDAQTRKKVEINLSDIGEPTDLTLLNKNLKAYNNKLNKTAKNIYNSL